MIDLTILGRSAGYPEPGGACSCYLVRGPGAVLVLDFGPGALSRLGLYQSPDSVDAILLSHMHEDHILDLVPLTRALSRLGALNPEGPSVKLIVPPGGNSTLRALGFAFARPQAHLQGAGESNLKIMSVDLFSDFFDLAEYDPDHPLRFGGLEVQVVPMRHVGSAFEPLDTRSNAYGFRITDGESVLAYTGDTGDNPGLETLARDADVLLCEAFLRSDDPGTTGPHDHLTASQTGQIAARNGVGKLLLTHFLHPPHDAAGDYHYADLAEIASKEFDGTVEAVEVGSTYKIGV